MADLRVLILADDALSRAGLGALISAQPGHAVMGQAASSTDLASALEIYRPDVVLWDLGWDPEALLPRLADLRDAMGPVRLPWLVLLPDGEQAAEVWAAGARALLLRDADGERLAAGLAAAVAGLSVLDPLLAGALIAARDAVPALPVEALTPRETEVLRLVAEGMPNKAIARRLGISEHTVKFHVNAILGKLGAESRTEAVVRATRLGLILL